MVKARIGKNDCHKNTSLGCFCQRISDLPDKVLLVEVVASAVAGQPLDGDGVAGGVGGDVVRRVRCRPLHHQLWVRGDEGSAGRQRSARPTRPRHRQYDPATPNHLGRFDPFEAPFSEIGRWYRSRG